MNSLSKFTLLAIETSTDACSVALLKGSGIISVSHVEAKKHTQILLKMIDDIFLKAGLSIKDCDCLAFGCGPGSFTGVRIASSVIQGFGLASQIPIVPVSTLRAIAQAACRKNNIKYVLALLDARMQQYYAGLFKADENGIMQKMGEEFLKSETELADLLIEQNTLLQNTQNQSSISQKWHRFECLPDAYDIATIAEFEFKLGKVITAAQIEPIYMRDPIR